MDKFRSKIINFKTEIISKIEQKRWFLPFYKMGIVWFKRWNRTKQFNELTKDN